jgi:hypothetical protein
LGKLSTGQSNQRGQASLKEQSKGSGFFEGVHCCGRLGFFLSETNAHAPTTTRRRSWRALPRPEPRQPPGYHLSQRGVQRLRRGQASCSVLVGN